MKTSIRVQLPPVHAASCAAPRIALAGGLLAMAASCSSGGGADLGDPLPTSSAPPSDATTSLFTDLGKSFLEGGAGEAGSSFTGWALGQLGLAGTDSSGQALAEIESTLQDIDAQLKEIAAEISELIGDTVVANCQQLSSALTNDLGRINTLLGTYNTIICTGNGTCADGAAPSIVPEAELMTFMDNVLDTQGGGANGMDAILDRIQQALVGATQGGIIAACINPDIPGLGLPADGAFNDADYYTSVHPVAAYYYYYQTVATLLYCEAQRYRAYITAGAPDAGTLDPDDMKSYLLDSTDPEVVFIMNETSQRMETTWGNLRNQFNLVGAPYTNEDLLLRIHDQAPVLYVLDMDSFTFAAGESCSDLTTENYVCTSIIRGPYGLSAEPLAGVEYADQKGHWSFANRADLANLMVGWGDNEAWKYLALNDGTTTRGFKNLSNKVLITSEIHTATTSLQQQNGGHSTMSVDYAVFLDGNLHYQTPGLDGHLPVDNSKALLGQMNIAGVPNTLDVWGAERTTHDFLVCEGTVNIAHSTSSPTWTSPPGWLPGNTSLRASAFHLPVIHINSLTPNTGLQARNAAGMRTMCTDDFEAWFQETVPAPQLQ